MQLNLKNPLVFFDLETTGVNITHDKIIEMSFLKIMPNGDQDSKYYQINPEIPIPAESTLIHGIYDEDVKDKPTFKHIARDLAKYLEGCDLSGFSIINFDVPMLVEEFLRIDVEFDVKSKKFIDSQKLFHLMEKRNLSSAYKFYCGKDLKEAHTAEADTLASMEILIGQIKKYNNHPVTNPMGKEIGTFKNDMSILHELAFSKRADLAGRLGFNDQGKEVFNFGKYKNQEVSKIFEKEPQYYDWIMKSDFPLDTKRKITIIKLRSFEK